MSLSLAPIQISSFQLLKSNFEVLSIEQPAESSNTFNSQFNASDLIEREDGQKGLKAYLIVHLIPKNGSKAQYSLEVSARGYFLGTYSEEGGSLEDFIEYMKTNAYSLLYGYIRSHVQQISSMSAVDTINLPCIDVRSIANNLAKPAEEKPAEEQPAEEKLVGEETVEEQPAKEETVDEKPVEKKPAPKRTRKAKTTEN